MGSTNSGIKRAAFNNQLFPAGLDLNRCEVLRSVGTWKAASSASWRQGAPVMLNSSGEVVLADGTALLGVAKWGKVSLWTSVVINESVLFGTSAATKTLKHANIVSGSVIVRSTTAMTTGTEYALTTDYTMSLTNGTITHVASGSGGSIDEEAAVYISYTWSLTESDAQLEGKNFWNTGDYVTVQNGNIAVIQAPAQIFTTEYDSDQQYALTGAKSNIYVNSAGLFTSATGTKFVGNVINVPTASDPFLGIEFTGQAIANT